MAGHAHTQHLITTHHTNLPIRLICPICPICPITKNQRGCFLADFIWSIIERLSVSSLSHSVYLP